MVVSLFVNPAQFNERSDLERYPRSERDDAALAAAAGADVLFAPSVEEVYPPGFATSVEVLGVTERLEGAARGAEHFRGVATVVNHLILDRSTSTPLSVNICTIISLSSCPPSGPVSPRGSCST